MNQVIFFRKIPSKITKHVGHRIFAIISATESIKKGKKNKTRKILLGREKLDGKNKIAQIERIIYQKGKGAIKEVAIVDKITKITNLAKLN